MVKRFVAFLFTNFFTIIIYKKIWAPIFVGPGVRPIRPPPDTTLKVGTKQVNPPQARRVHCFHIRRRTYKSNSCRFKTPLLTIIPTLTIFSSIWFFISQIIFLFSSSKIRILFDLYIFLFSLRLYLVLYSWLRIRFNFIVIF